MNERRTADMIALILALVVAIVVVGTCAALLLDFLLHPGVARISAAGDTIGTMVNVLVGALVGYIAGRKVNGHGS